MFSKVKNVVRNHWKKAVIGGVVVQGIIVGARYATRRFLDYHESQTNDLLQNMRREKHFESMESTFQSSFIALAINLKETVLECLDANSIADELKTLVGGDIKVKLQMWETLKIMGFARVLVIIYGTSLLNILLRIQLSIIGGYLFLESTQSEPKHEWRNVNGIILSHNTAIDKDLQQKYLSLASHLVKDGVRKLCERIYSRVAEVVESVSLRQKVSISDLEQMFLVIASGIHRDILPDVGGNSRALAEMSTSPIKYPWKYVFPTEILEGHDNFRKTPHCRPHYEPPDMYERLLSDTFDLLDSDDVIGLLSTFERQGISNFCDRLGELVDPQPVPDTSSMSCDNSQNPDTTANPNETENHILAETGIPMAKIIPLLNRLVAQGIQTESDPWLSVLLNSEVSKTLGTNVYESFSNASVEY